MVKITDIARDLHVSVATVSNALSGKGRMTEETRNAILKRAEQLGYKYRIRSKQNKKKNIAIISEQIGHIYGDLIVEGICDEVIGQDIDVTIYNLGVLSRNMTKTPKIEDLSALLQTTIAKMDRDLSGIIYVSQYMRDVTGLIENLPYPIVFTFCTTNDSYCTINYDDRQGAYQAVEFLVRHGKSRIAMVSGPIDSIGMSYRTIGYQQALIDNGLSFDPKLIRIGDWGIRSGYEVMSDLLLNEARPDSVFAQNDQMGIGAMHAILAHGFSIPDDIAMIGFDNSMITQYCTPTLSSVDPGFNNLGRHAINQLVKIINKESKVDEQVLLPCKIVHRKSSNFNRKAI